MFQSTLASLYHLTESPLTVDSKANYHPWCNNLQQSYSSGTGTHTKLVEPLNILLI